MIEFIAVVALLAYIVLRVMDLSPVIITPEGFEIHHDSDDMKFEKDLIFNFKKDTNIPEPDPAIGDAAKESAELGKEWLEFSKGAYDQYMGRQAEMDELTKEQQSRQLALQDKYEGIADADRARYEEKFRPLEDRFADEAATAGSLEEQEAVAAGARADVLKSADMQKKMRTRDMARMGLDPTSGRYAGIEKSGDVSTALAAAGSENLARKSEKARGDMMRRDAINLGKGIPSQSMMAEQFGLNTGTGAIDLSRMANRDYMAGTNLMNQGYSGGMSGIGQGANIMSNLYGNQLNAAVAQNQANQQMWSDIGTGVGTIGMLAATGGIPIPSDKKIKKNKKKVDGAADAIDNMDIEKWTYKEGQGDGGTHVGPYAQDFKRETGLGDGKTINIIDALGLTMKAVQEVNEKVDDAVSSRKFKRVEAAGL
jgi:hypothetical protein